MSKLYKRIKVNCEVETATNLIRQALDHLSKNGILLVPDGEDSLFHTADFRIMLPEPKDVGAVSVWKPKSWEPCVVDFYQFFDDAENTICAVYTVLRNVLDYYVLDTQDTSAASVNGQEEPREKSESGKTVRFELVFKGTLDQFRAAVNAIRIREAIPTESMLNIGVSIVVDDPLEGLPDLARFSFCLDCDKPQAIEKGDSVIYIEPASGTLIAQTLPGGKCLLTVKVDDKVWPKLARPWALFQAELERQGWIEPQPTESAALGDGQQGERITALLQRIYGHFVTHGEWPRYYDLEIEMHDVAPLYEIISGIDESLLLYEWPIQESSICFLTLKGIEKCNGSERDIQNFLRATDLFARRYIRDRATATINNHDLVSELGMSESEADRACKLILRYGGVLREGASSSGNGRWHEFRASRKALHFEGVSTLEDYFKRETRAWEAEKSEADRAMRPVRAHGSHPTDHRAMLRQNLVDHFNREELRTLCFDLGIEHEDLPDTKDGLARELVVHCQRSGIITDLVGKCRERRPKVSWEGKYD